MSRELGQQESAWVSPCRGVDAVGGYPLLTALETPKAPAAQHWRKHVSSHSCLLTLFALLLQNTESFLLWHS